MVPGRSELLPLNIMNDWKDIQKLWLMPQHTTVCCIAIVLHECRCVLCMSDDACLRLLARGEFNLLKSQFITCDCAQKASHHQKSTPLNKALLYVVCSRQPRRNNLHHNNGDIKTVTLEDTHWKR